jgi:hypothetical protein
VPILKSAPGIRAIAVLEEIRRRQSRCCPPRLHPAIAGVGQTSASPEVGQGAEVICFPLMLVQPNRARRRSNST